MTTSKSLNTKQIAVNLWCHTYGPCVKSVRPDDLIKDMARIYKVVK